MRSASSPGRSCRLVRQSLLDRPADRPRLKSAVMTGLALLPEDAAGSVGNPMPAWLTGWRQYQSLASASGHRTRTAPSPSNSNVPPARIAVRRAQSRRAVSPAPGDTNPPAGMGGPLMLVQSSSLRWKVSSAIGSGMRPHSRIWNSGNVRTPRAALRTASATPARSRRRREKAATNPTPRPK